MDDRLFKVLSVALRETTSDGEALNAIRLARPLFEKVQAGALITRPAEPLSTSRLRAEVAKLRTENETLTAELERVRASTVPPLEDQVREAVATSKTKAEAIGKLRWALNTYSYRRLDDFGFDQSHFLGQGWRRGKRKTESTRD